jgi:hypothetical protein
MALFLDTRGKSTLGIGICGRCSVKMSLTKLHPDPNTPGLMVCRDDLDVLDPWRLAPRETEDITLQYPRPDTPLYPLGPSEVYVKPIQAALAASAQVIGSGTSGQGIAVAPPVTAITPATTWLANTWYALGASVTQTNPYGFQANDDVYAVWVAMTPGLSGFAAPSWNVAPGSVTTDNQVLWFNAGLFFP